MVEKKRVRATWGMVRELKSQLSELQESYDKCGDALALKSARIDFLEALNEELSKKNDALSKEVAKLKDRCWIRKVLGL